MLINGTLNGYMSMGNMGNDYATAGKTKLHDGSKGSSYAIPVSRKVQGNDGTFQNDAKQYTREELISNLKEFFDMAMLNQGNQYIFALSPGGRNTIAKIEGEANMSDFRFAEVLAEVLKEYPGLSNVTFTTHYAKIINDINLDSSLEAKIKKINEDRGTKQYKCK
jgi:predicted naringenin-chalcone synthase